MINEFVFFLEKDKVYRTKRLICWHKVLWNRSIRLVLPISLPTTIVFIS